jgi:hypothetical protein
MCGCDELEHSLKCGGCAKLQVSEKNVVPIIDLQEYNGDGFPLVKLLKGRDNVERNFVLFDSNKPFFTKLKGEFREIIIQRGHGSMATIVKKLFEEGVFPPNETFEEVFAKVLEDYMHGLLWGVLIKIYESNNKTQYPIAPSLMYKVNYCAGFNKDFVVFDKGFFDAKINESQLKSTRLKIVSGNSRYCSTDCSRSSNSIVTDCSSCPN